MRRSTRLFAPQLSGFAETGLLGAVGSAMRSAHRAAVGIRLMSDPSACSWLGSRATMSCGSRAVRSVASVRYVRYSWAIARPGEPTYPTCKIQNMPALARSQAADS
eukprot:4176492-Pleurochrysis_carterae.AAC.1